MRLDGRRNRRSGPPGRLDNADVRAASRARTGDNRLRAEPELGRPLENRSHGLGRLEDGLDERTKRLSDHRLSDHRLGNHGLDRDHRSGRHWPETTGYGNSLRLSLDHALLKILRDAPLGIDDRGAQAPGAE